MSPISLLLWIQLFLVVFCSVEESIELSTIKRSHVLCYALRLALELLVSLLRVPIRCLAYIRLCKPSHVYEFVGLTRDITQFLDLWTEEEFVMDAAYTATRDELLQERRRNVHDARLQTQLTSAQADVVRLRRENATLALRLHELHAERTGLHEDFDRRSEAFQSLNESAAEERTTLFARLAGEQEAAAHSLAALEVANARIRELVAKLKSNQDVLTQSKATCKRLADERQQQSTTIANLRLEVKHLKDKSWETCRQMELKFQQIRKQHAFATRRLLSLVVLLHGSCHSLAARFRSALHVKDVAMSRWRSMSTRKVEANRMLVRYLRQNEVLKDQLEDVNRFAHCDDGDLEKEALAYRTMYHDSVRTRRATANIFLAFQHRTESRFVSATSNLLAGVLFLWRLNLILTKRLDVANSSILALCEDLKATRALLNRETCNIGVQCNPPATPPRNLADAAVQWSPVTPPRVLSNVSVQCSPSTPPRFLATVSVQCSPATPPRQLSTASVQCSPMTPPRELVDVSTQTLIKTKPPRSVQSPPPVTLPPSAPTNDSHFAFGNFTSSSQSLVDIRHSAPLLLPSPLGHPFLSTPPPSSPPKVDVDAQKDSSKLDERLQRLLEKFDALNSVHCAYRDLLLAKTRAPAAPPPARPQAPSRHESRESIFDRRRSLATSIHAS